MDFDIQKTSNGTSDTTQVDTSNVLASDIDDNENNYLRNTEATINNTLNDNTLPSKFNDFIDVLSQNNTSAIGDKLINQATKTNGKRRAEDGVGEYDDLGPETDVDTLDEVMSSPKELKEDLNQFDDKEICETNDDNLPAYAIEKCNPFSDDFDAMQHELVQTHQIDNNILGFDLGHTIVAPEFDTNPFEDNKLRDLIEEDETKVTSDLVEKMLSREHIFEKRDNSFEKEEVHHDNVDEDLINEFTDKHAQPFDLAAEVSKQVEAVAQAQQFNDAFQIHGNHQNEQNALFDESNNSQGMFFLLLIYLLF